MKINYIVLILISILISSCGGGGGGSSSDNNPTPTPTPAPTPAPQPTVNLDGPSGNVEKSTEFSISWASSNATTCNASGYWSGERGLSGSESFSIDVTGEYQFALECSNSSGPSASDSLTVTIVLPPLSYPVPLTFWESDMTSDSVVVTTEEKNSSSNKSKYNENIKLANNGLPVAYTQDEYNKSFIYQSGDLYEINPIFKFVVDVEREFAVQAFDYEGYAIFTTAGNEIFITNVTNERNETSYIAMLVNESQELIYGDDGNPIFIRSDDNECSLIRDENDELVLVEAIDIDGNPIYRILDDGTSETAVFPIVSSSCTPQTDDEGNYVYETEIRTVQEERETECDLSELGVEIYRSWPLDENDPSKLLLWLETPKEILNADCQVGYSEEFAIVSDDYSGIVTEAVTSIDQTNSYYSVPAWIVPGNLKGRNDSPHGLIYSDQYSNQSGSGHQAWEINISEGRVDFIQLIPSTKTVARELGYSAYNGSYYVQLGGSFGRPATMTVYKKGEPGFEYVEVNENECIHSNTGWLPGDPGSGSSILFVGENEVAVRTSDCPKTTSTWMKYSLTDKIWSTYGYDGTESSWTDIVGCEASNPNDTYSLFYEHDLSDDSRPSWEWPKEFFNTEGYFKCKNITFPLAATWGTPVAFYKDWIISGDYGSNFYNGNYATNLVTGESTGTLNCQGFTNETGRSNQVASFNGNGNVQNDYCGGPSFSFKNFIHTVSDQGYVFLRYDLDTNSYVRFDLRSDTDYELAGDPYILFKDRVFLQYIDPSDANLYYLELDFETGEMYERGLIENAEYRVISFVKPL